MGRHIGFDEVTLRYATIPEAREMSGLRLVLGEVAVAAPWREACKGLFDIKGIPYTPVRSCNAGFPETALGEKGAQSDLIAWTGQSSSPVAVWNDERPLSAWIDQLNLAERLKPEPRLIPEDMDVRIRMIGFINEIAGENGLGWNKRTDMVRQGLASLSEGDEGYSFWKAFATKYHYSPEAAAGAKARIIEIFGALDRQLAAQQARGVPYMVGDGLSALDIYATTFYGLFDPMEEARNPMATDYRPVYENQDPDIARVLTPALRAHRDRMYEEHLPCPIVF